MSGLASMRKTLQTLLVTDSTLFCPPAFDMFDPPVFCKRYKFRFLFKSEVKFFSRIKILVRYE